MSNGPNSQPLNQPAFGWPGIPARWTSSAKSGMGTALGNTSHVWFTLSHGVFNEIYYPRIDQACVRDMELIVTDGVAFFSEEKRDTHSDVQWLADGVPAFELAAGRPENARRLLHTMESFANDGGLISEQVWDSPDLPDRDLHLGRPSGSAMPLVWAHAEYLKLQRSLRDGRIFDLPPQTVQRYLVEKTVSPRLAWRFNHKLRWLPIGMDLRIETLTPATIRFSVDAWRTVQNVSTRDVGLGIHIADLTTSALTEGNQIEFTFYWLDADHWEGANFDVRVGNLGREPASSGEKSATG